MSTDRTLVRVALNIDLGELPDEADELYALATTVNVACGGHAGDARSMSRALEAARTHGATVAAHPSYPDRAGFGRISRFCDAAGVRVSVASQCRALRTLAEAAGITIRTMKPHGALYHDASAVPGIGSALLDGAVEALPDLTTVVGPPDSAFGALVLSRGLGFLREGFADRRYDAQHRLVPRSQPGALITDPEACVDQALDLALSGRIDTLCAHGDTPGAVLIARAVRQALEARGLLAA